MERLFSRFWKTPQSNKDPPLEVDNTENDDEFQRFSRLIDEAAQRLNQDYVSKKQQKKMILIGNALSMYRQKNSELTQDLLAASLGITAQDMFYAELGILEPSNFFQLIDSWTEALDIDANVLMDGVDHLTTE